MGKKIIAILFIVNIVVWYSVVNLPSKNLKIIFCNVGQGDGAVIIHGWQQMVIDGGPDNRIMDCLGKYMPVFDRTIEAVIATHPQADHVAGIADVIRGYSLIYYVSSPANNETEGYASLVKMVEDRMLKVEVLYAGDMINFGEFSFSVVWPTKEFAENHILSSNAGNNRAKVLGLTTDGIDLNGFGISGILNFGSLKTFFTADADMAIQPDELSTGLIQNVNVLKVPHHGSKTGMNKDWLALVDPELAIISSGKGNRYGHPAIEAIKMLEEVGSQVKRTDTDGNIVVESDGKSWWVKK